MAKRYYKSENSSSGEFATFEDSRRIQLEDSGMIKEDHKAVSNLPQEVMIKDWPKYPRGNMSSLDDTLTNVDHQIAADSSKFKKGPFPEKY
jgi:hypothetical protein